MKYVKKFEAYRIGDDLCHSTDMNALYSILMQDVLGGTTPQKIDDVMVYGVSLTYDKDFIYKNNELTLELSSDILDKYPYREIDFFETDFGKSKMDEFGLQIEDEKEVFVITKGIKPLNKYLKSIYLRKKINLDEDLKEIISSNFPDIKIYNHLNKDITKKVLSRKKGGFRYDDDNFLF